MLVPALGLPTESPTRRQAQERRCRIQASIRARCAGGLEGDPHILLPCVPSVSWLSLVADLATAGHVRAFKISLPFA